MSQVLALEWNGHEVRAAVAARRGDRVTVEQAFVVPMAPSPEAGAQELGPLLAAALAARGVGSLDAMAAVGRGGVELRQLQLPAASDAELPGMVRLRAMLEFNELDERWPLDFAPIDDAGDSPRRVLAAAIAPAAIEAIQAVCRQCGVKLQRVLLRSCAAATLAARAPQPGRVRLLVELFSGLADLTAVVDGRVLLPRMVRLGGDVWQDAAARHGLLTEIRLTMAAVQNQFDGRQIESVALCGRGEADAALARQIEEAVGVRTVLWDPFAGLELGPQLRESPPPNPGRFAAVLGMLVQDAGQARRAIDFLHPRQSVVPPDPRKKWWFIGVAAGLLAAAYFVYGRVAHWRLDAEVRRLEARAAEADDVLRRIGARNLATAAEIADWADGAVVWLDQLRQLSVDFPPAEVAAIDHITFTSRSARPVGLRITTRTSTVAEMPGRMHLEGWARDNKGVDAMEQGLRAHGRRLEGSKTVDDRSLPPYSVKFRTTVQVGQKYSLRGLE